jgi:RNA ligase
MLKTQLELIDLEPTYGQFGAVKVFCERYQLKAKYHTIHPDLVLLKYSQIDSPMGEQCVQECRGLVLDTSKFYEPVSMPFKKFFNAGEGHAAVIDWPSARVYEKLDGSMISLAYYKDQWHWQTTGTPDGSGTVGSLDITFAQLAQRTFSSLGYRLPGLDKEKVFTFELMTPLNRVIVRHETSKMVLLAVRDMTTLQEYWPEDYAGLYGWECARTVSAKNLDEVEALAAELVAATAEGFVVVDKDFNRLKIKAESYVRLNYMKESLTPAKLVEVVQAGEESEFGAYFPEWGLVLTEIKSLYSALVERLDTAYSEIKDLEVQKDFAFEALKLGPWSGVLFSMRKLKATSSVTCLSTMSSDKLVEHLAVQKIVERLVK